MEQKINALVIKADDSVAVAIEALQAGDIAVCRINAVIKQIKVVEDIPIYHKFALTDIPTGLEVYKYGESIGQATSDITVGQHIHSHNLVSIREAICR